MKDPRHLITLSLVLLSCSVQAVVVTYTPSPICDLIPKDTQGANGIRLQYRTAETSDYTDLTYFSDYDWCTPSTPWNIPLARRVEPGKWLLHPAAVVQCYYNRDAVIRVLLEGPARAVRIAGKTGTTLGSTSVTFYIYKGSNSWSSPLWAGSPGQTFSFVSECQAGDEFFIATNAQDEDVNDAVYYQDVTFTAADPPTDMLYIRTSQIELCWNTIPNTWYQLQYRSELTDGWTPLTGNWISGTGSKYCTNDAVLPRQPHRFYRFISTNSLPPL